jgi:hypothetical protein
MCVCMYVYVCTHENMHIPTLHRNTQIHTHKHYVHTQTHTNTTHTHSNRHTQTLHRNSRACIVGMINSAKSATGKTSHIHTHTDTTQGLTCVYCGYDKQRKVCNREDQERDLSVWEFHGGILHVCVCVYVCIYVKFYGGILHVCVCVCVCVCAISWGNPAGMCVCVCVCVSMCNFMVESCMCVCVCVCIYGFHGGILHACVYVCGISSWNHVHNNKKQAFSHTYTYIHPNKSEVGFAKGTAVLPYPHTT